MSHSLQQLLQLSFDPRHYRWTLIGQSGVKLNQRRTGTDFVHRILATRHTADSHYWDFPYKIIQEWIFSVCSIYNHKVRRGRRRTFGEAVHLSHSVGGEVFERLAAQTTNLRPLQVLKRLWPGHGGIRHHQTVHSQLKTHTKDRTESQGPKCTAAKRCVVIMSLSSSTFFCLFQPKHDVVPTAVTTSAMSRLSCEVRSGAILTRTGGMHSPCMASRSVITWAHCNKVVIYQIRSDGLRSLNSANVLW